MSTPRKAYKTSQGLELPLLNLKGKEYLQVMHRIQWFRTEHPTGAIRTQLIDKFGEGANAGVTFKAEIFIPGADGQHMLVATAHKSETHGDFPAGYIEKAESGSIGRALALVGYGTQFCADELDEGTRLADSPAPQAAPKPVGSFRRSSPVGDDI